MSSPPVVAVVGSTASGKTALSLDLAAALHGPGGAGEIVNTDAMALYRGMDVGTAKPAVAERRGIPHHLLDVLDVAEPASVAEFQALARAAVDDCVGRGVTPVLVGGSALYTRAVLDRFEFPGTDPVIRERWETRLADLGAESLHAELAVEDPAAAAAILPTNGRRIVRALEVIELTGRPFSATLPTLAYFYEGAVQIGVDIPRDVLDDRIARRVVRMWEDGFVDEVRRLERRLRVSRTAAAAIGYQQVLALLAGEVTEGEAMLMTVNATRRFARKQEAWFKKDPRVVWLPYDAPDLVERALRAIERVTPAA